MEPREVCKICYNSTSHKPSPTLTHEPKDSSDEESGSKTCSVCHQEWAPIRVAKELGSSRWVRIRPRPKLHIHIDFMMCKNLKNRNECPKGQDCSYAHSQAELWAWNQERQKEPRPAPHINGSYQYQLCKYISKSGNCPYGVKCTFAHNEEELQSWLKVQGPVGGGGGGGGQLPRGSSSSYGSGGTYVAGGNYGTYKCSVCQLKCNSKKQFEDHLNSSRHRQQHHQGGGAGGGAGLGYNKQQTGTNSNRHYRPNGGQTRAKPTLSFHITGFRLCVHIQNGRRCLYGDYCTFAHSQAELDEWNRPQAQHANEGAHSSKTQGDKADSASEDSGSGQESTMQSLMVTSNKHVHNSTKMEFSMSVRLKVAKEHKDRGTVAGIKSGIEGVTLREVTDTELAISTASSSPISWVFELSTSVSHILQSVVLFDSLNSDFDLTYVLRGNSGSWEKLPAQATAEQGVGTLLNYKMLSTEKLQVKVTAKPRAGLLGQLIIFQFESFRLLQCMVVRMISENEQKLLKSTKTNSSKRPADVDLFWENRFNKIAMRNVFVEETDRHLPEYLLPQQIETLIEKGKYSNVENRVTKENYKRRMHNLLYLEEYQQRLDLSRYDLYDIEVKPQNQYSASTLMGVNYAEKGYHFISLTIDELLFEGGQSIRQGDSALLLPGNQQVVHECLVEHVGRESAVIKITDKAKQASASSRFRVSVRFVLGRTAMQSMHYAVDQLDLDAIFPVVQTTPNTPIPTSSDVQECLDLLKDSELNQFQLQAITSILDSSCLKIPSLVLGPFGCGKTRTLSECIELLALHMPKSCVLVCTHSNSAADLYVENLDTQWMKYEGVSLSLYRLYYTGRKMNTIRPTVKKYCKISQDGKLSTPSLAEIMEYKVVIATLSTARALSLMDLPKGHFTHIFIDEAAQALESETLIPLSLANSQTKIVLAGDHMQLDPPVYSDIARRYGLHVSMLERLYDMEAYESGVGQLCKTLLTENHRSHNLILGLPSQLFYKNKLSCKAVFPTSGPEVGPVDLPAVKFVCVEGHEQQDEDSPSYYNVDEALKVAEEAKCLTDGGLRAQDICVLAFYSKQVQLIRSFLRQKKLGQVQVHRVEDVQGKEFRALMISTVRTSSTELSSEKEAGFLTNPKLFNTAVTRARQWLVVVGEPVTLCTMGSNRLCWFEYIKRCIGLKSFDHPHPSQFIGNLDYKMVTRQLAEKCHQEFFKNVIQRRPTAKTVSTPTSEQPTAEPSSSYFKSSQAQMHSSQPVKQQQVRHGSQPRGVGSTITNTATAHRAMTQEPIAAESTQPHPQHTHTFASKVQDSRPELRRNSSSVSNGDGFPSPKPLVNHSSSLQATSPNHSSVHSSSPEQVTLSSMDNTHNDASTLNDLPEFLRTMVDSVSSCTEWCEDMLAASYPLKISSKVNDNLQRQKAILESQTKFVQEQINLYRDYMKLRDSKGSVGPVDVSSSQQFHFPTALPPNPHPLSAGLNSAFTYDAVANSYFSSGSSSSLRTSSNSRNLMKDRQQLKSSGPSL